MDHIGSLLDQSVNNNFVVKAGGYSKEGPPAVARGEWHQATAGSNSSPSFEACSM